MFSKPSRATVTMRTSGVLSRSHRGLMAPWSTRNLQEKQEILRSVLAVGSRYAVTMRSWHDHPSTCAAQAVLVDGTSSTQNVAWMHTRLEPVNMLELPSVRMSLT
jgi:hypothetical protein